MGKNADLTVVQKKLTPLTNPERIVRQRPFKMIWEHHKEWSEAGVSASRVTTQTYPGYVLLQLSHSLCQAIPQPETTSEASQLG